MTRKKIIYIVSAVVIIILGYFNYFAKEKELKEIKKVIETKNAIYESDDYYVEAEKEYNYIDEKESKFEMAKAKVKGMILKGDNVLLDKARNLILKSNIVGISPNGWEVNASELKYIKETDELVSNEYVSAKNEEEGIEISGQVFKTNISMDYITLEKGVVIKNKIFSLSADRAKYSNDTKIVELEGNITIFSDEETKLSGNFNEVYYNVKERNLYVNKGFDIDYQGIKLSGENIVLNDRDETFKIEKNVKIFYQDYIFDVESIEKKKDSNSIDIYGKIKGGNEIYKLVADSGIYNIDEKKFTIEGNINVESVNKEKLTADRVDYGLDTKEMEIFGKPFRYLSLTNNLEADYVKYNVENKIATTDKRFYAFNNKKEYLKGSDFTYNLNTGDFSAKSDLILSYGDYELKGENITFVGETSTLTIPSDFEINQISTKNKVVGQTLTYIKQTGELSSPNKLNFYMDSLKVSGENFNYNNISNLGKINGPIIFEDKENNMFGSAKEVFIKNKDFIELVGKIEAKQNSTQMRTENIKYVYSDGQIHIENPILLKDDVKKLDGEILKAVYNPKTKILKAYKLYVKEPTRNIQAGEVNYYTQAKKVEFLKNVVINSDKNKIKAEKMVYNLSNEDIELKSKNQINYNNYLINSDYMKFNNKTTEISANNVVIKSEQGNEFSAKETSGNLNKGLIKFVETVKANFVNKNEKIKFEGEMLDLYLEKNRDKYVAKKVIINKNATLTQLNKRLESDSIEADLIKNIVYVKNRPTLIVDNSNKRKTLAKADEATISLDTKIVNLDGNIYIEDLNDKEEKITLTADRAIVKENIGSVYSNVKVKNKEGILTANEGHYDMNTKKIKLKGNVHMDYVTEKEVKK